MIFCRVNTNCVLLSTITQFTVQSKRPLVARIVDSFAAFRTAVTAVTQN